MYETINEYRQYIEELPQNDEPEIFGMHENANIAFQTQETNALISTILEVQPRTSSGGVGKSNDDIATDLCENILGKLMDKLDIELASQDMFQVLCCCGGCWFSAWQCPVEVFRCWFQCDSDHCTSDSDQYTSDSDRYKSDNDHCKSCVFGFIVTITSIGEAVTSITLTVTSIKRDSDQCRSDSEYRSDSGCVDLTVTMV